MDLGSSPALLGKKSSVLSGSESVSGQIHLVGGKTSKREFFAAGEETLDARISSFGSFQRPGATHGPDSRGSGRPASTGPGYSTGF